MHLVVPLVSCVVNVKVFLDAQHKAHSANACNDSMSIQIPVLNPFLLKVADLFPVSSQNIC